MGENKKAAYGRTYDNVPFGRNLINQIQTQRAPAYHHVHKYSVSKGTLFE